MRAIGGLFTAILFITWNIVQPAVVLIEPRMYIQKIAKRVAELLESRYLTGPDLPIDNYTSPIELSSYGITLSGNVSIHSAFVAKIGSMELNMQQYREILQNTVVQIDATMQWRNVATAMDFYADLEGFQGSGTLMVTYGHFDLPLKTQLIFETGEVSGSLLFQSISSQNDIIIVGHPNNAHVQMIARAINTNFNFRDNMLEPFRRWNFLNILNVALSEIPFPQICYNC